MNNNHIVIMAGGIGSRFWPMSTPECPKQFIDVMGCGKTMIQMTVERFAPLCPLENFWVVTSAEYVDTVHAQLPQIPVQNILAEPAMRNTAPCIAYACWKIRQQCPQANVVVTPADALVVDVDDFRKVITRALEFTAAGKRIVTVGIRPTRPETGYGYIQVAGNVILSEAKCLPQVQIHKVDSFKEKPQLEIAKQYLEAGNYLWNAGIFVWSVDTIVESMRAFVPDLAAKMDEMSRAFYTADEPAVVRYIFPTCEKISIDYAVMEKSNDVYVECVDIGWSDLGSWGAYYEKSPKAEHRNVIHNCRTVLNNCENNIFSAKNEKLIVASGLDGYVVADNDDILLICPLSEEQKIKQYVKEVKTNFGDKYL